MDSVNQLGRFLRARRAVVSPREAGLPDDAPRRTPGLKQEEVARLAGLSEGYYARLEQAREKHPSDQVLQALARVLRLNPDALSAGPAGRCQVSRRCRRTRHVSPTLTPFSHEPASAGEEIPMSNIVVITGASSGFGALTARALADAGNTVYAGMRETDGRNAPQVQAAADYAKEHGVDLRSIELDVNSDDSVDSAVKQVIGEHGRIDVLIHNAGHMVTGPAEAFTPEQFAQLYDINVLSTQRVNRAVLPHLRKAGRGLVVWVSSSSVKGGTPPYLAPYFAAKAAMDSLAVSYAGELARWGVETSIVVPGSFTSGTNHFAHSGHPADGAVEAEYETKYPGLLQQVSQKLAALAPEGAEASLVSDEIARIVALPEGERLPGAHRPGERRLRGGLGGRRPDPPGVPHSDRPGRPADRASGRRVTRRSRGRGGRPVTGRPPRPVSSAPVKVQSVSKLLALTGLNST
ncbi:hypothetical protein SCANM63S_06556 [Streptomyces canarius]